jgi:hypothetical protein
MLKSPLALALVLALAARPAPAWQSLVNGSGANSYDEARAVAIDANGDVIATGRVWDAARFWDVIAVKRNGVTGFPMYDRFAFGNSQACNCGAVEGAWGVALTPGGDAIAAGYLDYKTLLRQFAAIRFNAPHGFESWRAVFGDGRTYFSAQDEAFAVAVDPAGNVVVAGQLVVNFGPPYGDLVIGVVMKLSGASGASLWTLSINPPVRAIAVDDAGDVLAVGSDTESFQVWKLASSDGQPVWGVPIEVSDSRAVTVTVDGAGDVIAGGRASGAFVVKLAGATGETIWARDILTAGGPAAVAEVAVHPSGDVVAVGAFDQAGTGFGQLLVTRLAAATGDDVWPRFIASGSGNTAEATGVALDSAGDIVVSGSIWNSETSQDFAVLKVDDAAGTQLWRREFDVGTLSGDIAQDVAVDPADDVIAIGTLGADLAVLKMRGDDGADFPRCGDLTDDAIINTNDRLAIRNMLADLPGPVAPGRCSVIGGTECDILDVAVLHRYQNQLSPGLRSACADALP